MAVSMDRIREFLGRRIGGIPVIAFVALAGAVLLFFALRMRNTAQDETVDEDATGDEPGGDADPFDEGANPTFAASPTTPTVMAVPANDNNELWGQRARTYLMATLNQSAITANAVVYKYLNSQPTTPAEKALLNQVIAFLGYPPVIPDPAEGDDVPNPTPPPGTPPITPVPMGPPDPNTPPTEVVLPPGPPSAPPEYDPFDPNAGPPPSDPPNGGGGPPVYDPHGGPGIPQPDPNGTGTVTGGGTGSGTGSGSETQTGGPGPVYKPNPEGTPSGPNQPDGPLPPVEVMSTAPVNNTTRNTVTDPGTPVLVVDNAGDETRPPTQQGTPPTTHRIRNSRDNGPAELGILYYGNNNPSTINRIEAANTGLGSPPWAPGTSVRIPAIGTPIYYDTPKNSTGMTAEEVAAKNGITAEQVRFFNPGVSWPVHGTTVRVG